MTREKKGLFFMRSGQIAEVLRWRGRQQGGGGLPLDAKEDSDKKNYFKKGNLRGARLFLLHRYN